jgi:outer membrane protein
MTMNHPHRFSNARIKMIATVATAATSALLAATGVQAQSAGSLMIRAGATQIKPNVTSGDLTAPSFPGTQADIRADTQFSGGVSYMLTDSVSIDVPISLPFKHDIVGAGAIAGVGKIGEVRSLPITLLGQYRFLDPKSAIRPYLGAGVTYANFYKARSTAVLSALTGGTTSNPTTMEVKSKFAATLQLGATYSFSDRWFVEADLTHTFLKTRTTLSTGQTLDIKLDPDSYSIAIGYTF